MPDRSAALELHLDHVHVALNGRPVLAGVDLRLEPGQVAMIGGDSGSGKSTLLYVCAGLIVPTRGRVRLGGFDTAYWTNDVLAEKGVRGGFVFQQGGLLSNLTVLANVAMPLQYHRRGLGLTRAETRRRAAAALERVGIGKDLCGQLPAHVSQGTHRRVSVARLLALEPDIVFLDDPCAGLEPHDAARVTEALMEVVRRDAVTAVMVSTHPELSCPLGGRRFRLAHGRLHEAGD